MPLSDASRPSLQPRALSPHSAVETHCFAIRAAAAPGILPRILEVFAKRNLVPTKWHSAVFGPNGEEKSLGRNEGIVLPAGSFYRFHATSEEPLVLLRVGCFTKDRGDLKDRMGIDGGPLPGKSKANKYKAPVFRPNAFYE